MANRLQIDVVAKTDKARNNLNAVKNDLSKFGSQGKMTASQLAVMATGAFAFVKSLQGITDGIKKSIGLYATQEKAVASLNAVLKATGNAAGFSSEELQAQAAALQKLTTFGDEAIISMQGILLTFKNIKGDNFKRTQETALDLATVMGGDLKSAALQLGKALEDPETGLTALRRVGVSFTDQEKELIKSLKDAGREAEAQGVILDALAGQVGGAAKAIGETATGNLEQLKNAWGDLGEQIGRAFIQSFDSSGALTVLEKTTDKLKKSNDLKAILKIGKADISDISLISEEIDKLNKKIKDQQSNSEYGQKQVEVYKTQRAQLENIRNETIKLVDAQRLQQKYSVSDTAKQLEQEAKLRKDISDQLLQTNKTINDNKLIGYEKERAEIITNREEIQKTINLLAKGGDTKSVDFSNAVKARDNINKQLLDLEKNHEAEKEAIRLKAIQEAEDAETKAVDERIKKQKELEQAEKARFDALIASGQVVKDIFGNFRNVGKLEQDMAKFGAKSVEVLSLVSSAWSSIKGAISEVGNTLALASEKELKQYDDSIDRLEDKKDAEINAAEQSGLSADALTQKKAEIEAKYNEQIAALQEQRDQKENEIKRKQFEANKALKIIDAGINVALGITSALSAPFPANLILPPIIGAAGAVQIGAIAASQYPGLAEGGLVRGAGAEGNLFRLGDKNKDELVLPLDRIANLGIDGNKTIINKTYYFSGFVGNEQATARVINKITDATDRLGYAA